MLTASLRDMMAGVEHARAGEGGLLLTDAVRVLACSGQSSRVAEEEWAPSRSSVESAN